MKIHRYRELDRSQLEEFGQHQEEMGYHFKWFLGDNKVGLSSLPSTRAEEFYGGFLAADDTLIFNPNGPSIRRKHKVMTTIGSPDKVGIKAIIALLQEYETIHAYLSEGKILTFSATEPEGELYQPATIMAVEMDQDAEMLAREAKI